MSNTKSLLCLSASLVLLGACTANESPSASGGNQFFSSDGMSAGQAGNAGFGSAGVSGVASVAGSAGVSAAGASSTAGVGGSTTGTALPCDVDEAVRRNCQSCHSAHPSGLVPMSLVTWEDFQAPAKSNASLKVYELAALRVHDSASPMPPAPQVVPDEDKAPLEAWLAAGAPAGTDPSCAPDEETNGGNVDPGDVECFELLANGGDGTSPYQVNGEDYVNFYFDAPWAENAQGVSFESVFDDHPEVIHHWLLYLDLPPLVPDFPPNYFVQPGSSGGHIGATLIAGWAPGGNNGLNLPPDVGMDINGGSRKLVMEIHFYTNAPTTSHSGVKVCTTKTPRPNVATVSWLGTESINIPAGQMGTASGDCQPSSNQPIHILRSWPHMHQIGRHMETVINRAGGGAEMLVDEPFNFNTQISYDTPAMIMPGDTLTTTCTYMNDTGGNVVYGTHTSNEMCFNFVTAWPAGALVGGMAKNGAQNPCMSGGTGLPF